MRVLSVFYRLGRIGVFYGARLGYRVARCRAFPFSLLRHPQYVGTVLSIWGVFLPLRFPHADWYVLPVLETVYYTAGAHWERSTPTERKRSEADPVEVDARASAGTGASRERHRPASGE